LTSLLAESEDTALTCTTIKSKNRKRLSQKRQSKREIAASNSLLAGEISRQFQLPGGFWLCGSDKRKERHKGFEARRATDDGSAGSRPDAAQTGSARLNS